MIPAAELTARFGSPLYVYDLADVRAAHADLTRDLPTPHQLYYSLKANPHPELVGQLRSLGCRAEISSIGELSAAIAAGVSPARCLYTAPAKRFDDVVAAVTRGVRLYSVDSGPELRKVDLAAGSCGSRVDCLVRVNVESAVPGMGMSMTGIASQFGSDTSKILDRPADFRSTEHARVVGVHLYMGSNIADEDVLIRTFELGIDTARRLRDEAGLTVDVLDLGGGFASPYARARPRQRYPRVAAELSALLDRGFPGWRAGTPRLVFESGRYLAGGCGTLVCTVLDVKRSKQQEYVVLDAGINSLGGLAGLQRLPRMQPDVCTAADRPTRQVNVVGPLCTPADYWGRNVSLPTVSIGDIVTVPHVGAYGLTASLVAFLGHDLPAEVVVDGAEVVSATRVDLVRSAVAAASSSIAGLPS